MKVMLFLGSGISLRSGLPTTDDITNSLLNDKWHDHTDNNFYKGEHPGGEFWQSMNIVPKLQEFLKLLKENYDEYLKTKREIKSNYEDLFYICQQINNEYNGEIENPLIYAFLENLQEKTTEICKPIPNRKEKKINLDFLASRSLDLIQCVVWDKLYFNGDPQGLELILNLIKNKNVENLDIVTLNHDLLVEILLNNNNIEFVDGFGEADGDIRYFDPLRFKSENKINLFKLHGSINWHRFRKTTEENGKEITRDSYALALNPDHEHCIDSSGQMLIDLGGKPIFLTGSYNKLTSYNFGIFNHMHHQFDEKLFDHKYIIMSGYGWNDKGINGRLMEWISSSLDKKLILLHKNPESLKNSKSALRHRYDGLVEEGRLSPIKKWLSETNIEEILKILN